MTAWFIHLPDPTYMSGEFPFGRRLGPYIDSDGESGLHWATGQAVSDVAGGHGAVLGIYEESESEKLRDPRSTGDLEREVANLESQAGGEFKSEDERARVNAQLVSAREKLAELASVKVAVSADEIEALAVVERAAREDARRAREAEAKPADPEMEVQWEALEAQVAEKAPALVPLVRALKAGLLVRDDSEAPS